MQMTDYCTALHRKCHSLANIAFQLEELSQAFSRTGQESLCKELGSCADRLNELEAGLRRDYGSLINAEFQDSQRQVGKTLSLLLTKATEDAST